VLFCRAGVQHMFIRYAVSKNSSSNSRSSSSSSSAAAAAAHFVYAVAFGYTLAEHILATLHFISNAFVSLYPHKLHHYLGNIERKSAHDLTHSTFANTVGDDAGADADELYNDEDFEFFEVRKYSREWRRVVEMRFNDRDR
jgi:hypothetical protein